MNAFAILAGGGTKGIALAGCLHAASTLGIRFVGYGGTSAGALVALLASLGYTPRELRHIFIEELDYRAFFPDRGAKLARLHSIPPRCRGAWTTARQALAHRDLIALLRNKLGLYEGQGIDRFVRTKIVAKLPHLEQAADIGLHDLEPHCAPLKIVASNVTTRKPLTYSWAGKDEINGSIFSALRASMCYPFAFQPVSSGRHLLVDGGLSSNLPSFLFRKERDATNQPAIAFDLVPSRPADHEEPDFRHYCAALIDTALQASDALLRQASRDVIYVPVPLPSSASALDVELNRDQRDDLFYRGEAATHTVLRHLVPQWRAAGTTIERLQALSTMPPSQMAFVLSAVAASFQSATAVRDVRAYVMLPTGGGTLVIVYQHGMNGDPDASLELPTTAGCSGEAWTTREIVAGDYARARTAPRDWRMTDQQIHTIPGHRRAILGIPLFSAAAVDLRRAETVDDLRLLGVLCIDSATPLQASGWVAERAAIVEQLSKQWGGVVSKLLS